MAYASNPEKLTDKSLYNALHYIANEKKIQSDDVEHLLFAKGIGCEAQTAYSDMLRVQKHFGKRDGNVAYHAIQSFKPGEITPKDCHKIGVDIARKLWGDRYQVLVTTHLDTRHLHNHFVINSVSPVNGKKFNDDLSVNFEFRRVSDEMCKERNLSVIENPKGKTPRKLYFAEQNGEPTKFNLMRAAIDNALENTSTPQDFTRLLLHYGYVFSYTEGYKYATIRLKNSQKAVRTNRLGERYEIQNIIEQLNYNYYKYGSKYLENGLSGAFRYSSSPKHYRYKGKYSDMKYISGWKATIFVFLFLLGYRPQDKEHPRYAYSPEMREAIRRLDRYIKMSNLICKYDFKTDRDINNFIDNAKEKLQKLEHQRQKIYNLLRWCKDPSKTDELKVLRDKLTFEITSIRKEIKVGCEIIERSTTVHELIKKEKAQRLAQNNLMKKYRNKEKRVNEQTK